MESPGLSPTRCAICNTPGNAAELYAANFDMQALNPVVFSARRLPDRIHYRLVKCNTCKLVRSDPIAPPEVLAELYQQSTFTYAEEVANLKQTYGHYLAELVKYGAQKRALLEIGCGNGFFLEEALAQGYLDVRGVEPSQEAVLGASFTVRPNILCDIVRPGLFAPEQFDVVCMFQVLDHIPDPGILLEECFEVLKSGGLVLCLNHNIESWSARLMKDRSPIIDIEHTYLYSPATITHLFESRGFKVRRVGPTYNRYTINYLMRLVPLPTALKTPFLNLLKGSPLGRIPLSILLGNLFIVAQKPDMINPNVDVFDRDAGSYGGYLYTTRSQLSSRLATQRTTKAILDAGCFAERSVLDMGCGDGFYTMQVWDSGSPCKLIGVDAAEQAIKVANARKQQRPIQFLVGDAHRLPWPDNSFDVALIQSMLHHDDDPQDMIREAFRLAPEILIHEPNGNNLGLKIIEKTSLYHREHREKSYTPIQMNRWIKKAGGKIIYRQFAGFVPMFCTDGLARVMKLIEPILERVPLINAYGCAVVVLKARRAS